MTVARRILHSAGVPLFDAHNHLQDPRLASSEAEVFELYAKQSVERCVVNGTCASDWPRVAELAARREEVLPSFGLHPWRVTEAGPNWRTALESLWATHPQAGVGEIGLDRWIREPDFPAQLEAFRWQLAFATAENRATSIHCLQAWGPMLDVLSSTRLPERGFLLHSYGGSREMIDSFADLGAYFSLSGYFAHDRKSAQAEAFKSVPIERLLVETDAPDMRGPERVVEIALESSEGEPLNHPGNLPAIYRFAADLRGMELAAFEAQIEANWRRFFTA